MRITTLVIGAGHAGLAMSRCLASRSIDHVVLERGEVANSWKRERWASLRLLTPNWQSRLPGFTYGGPDPDGFRTMDETVAFIERYAEDIRAPVRTGTTVLSVRRVSDGYRVLTDRGEWWADTVVLATGACNLPTVPSLAEGVPVGIRQLTPMTYKRPDEIEPGGVLVVGASASGAQIAEELQRAGRRVTLSVGEHVRVPRTYRGRDIQWWMDAAGVLDERYDEVEDLARARTLPSLQLAGSVDRRNIDLNALTALGIRLVGRVVGVSGTGLQVSGSLANMCTLADLKMNRLLDRLDEWATEAGLDRALPPPRRFEPTRVESSPTLEVDLSRGEIQTIVWATGFRPDYSWLDVPVFDRKGRVRHDGGVVDAPGMYLMGLPFMRRRKSSLIDGAADDARDLSAHLARTLEAMAGRSPVALERSHRGSRSFAQRAAS